MGGAIYYQSDCIYYKEKIGRGQFIVGKRRKAKRRQRRGHSCKDKIESNMCDCEGKRKRDRWEMAVRPDSSYF